MTPSDPALAVEAPVSDQLDPGAPFAPPGPAWLAGLVSSRICHDLISPVGAVCNGVELVEEFGGGGKQEMALIGDPAGGAGIQRRRGGARRRGRPRPGRRRPRPAGGGGCGAGDPRGDHPLCPRPGIHASRP